MAKEAATSISGRKVLRVDEYKAACDVLEEAIRDNVDPLKACEALVASGIEKGTIISLHRQLVQRLVQIGGRSLRSTSFRRSTARRWRSGGASLLSMSRESRFPPYAFARCVLEGIAEQLGESDARGTARRWLKDPQDAPERVRAELLECARADISASPAVDAARHVAGAAYERYLERVLSLAGVPFETEDASREAGRARTPDALLTIPIGMLPSFASEPIIVNWIDSKAMFGDATTHCTDHAEQLAAYANRFGPGLVLYWGGLSQDITTHADAPAPQDIAVAAQLPSLVILPGDTEAREIPDVPQPDIPALVQHTIDKWWAEHT